MRDILPNLVLIEALVGCTVQLGERLVQAVGNGLALTFIYIGSQTDAQNGNNGRGSSNLRVEVDGVVGTRGRYIRTKGTTPPCKTCNSGIDTYTHRNDAEHNERNGHRSRSLVRSMVLVGLNVLCSPEDAIVQAEHVEGGHSGNTGHDPSYHRTVGKAGGDNLILRAEARKEGNTCDGEARNEEGDVRNRHILAQATHHSHLVRVDGMDDATGTEEQTSFEHSVGEQVEHTSHETELRVIVENTVVTRQ